MWSLGLSLRLGIINLCKNCLGFICILFIHSSLIDFTFSWLFTIIVVVIRRNGIEEAKKVELLSKRTIKQCTAKCAFKRGEFSNHRVCTLIHRNINMNVLRDGHSNNTYMWMKWLNEWNSDFLEALASGEINRTGILLAGDEWRKMYDYERMIFVVGNGLLLCCGVWFCGEQVNLIRPKNFFVGWLCPWYYF